MPRSTRWLNVALLFALLFSPSVYVAKHAAAAESDAGNSEPLNAFSEDRVFKGENAKQDAYFEIGKNRTVLPGSTVDISYSHSATLHPDYSTLTVLLDDVPIASVPLDHTNTDVDDWKIDISSFDLKPGFHKLSFWAKMKVNAAVCEDPQNSSAWLTIRNDSKINLRMAGSGSVADLTIYPSPFVARGAAKPVQTVLVVPDDINESEFKAAARLSQFFAAQSPNGLLRTPIVIESDATDAALSGASPIWLGAPDRWKDQGRKAMNAFGASVSGGEVIAKQGAIGVVASPWNEARSSMVVTGDGDKLVRGAEILTTELLYKQLQGGYSVIPDELPDAASREEDGTDKPYVLTLEKLGYGNLVTEDVLQGGSSIYYPIPNNWDLNGGATLRLKYKHSKSILFNKSVMKVLLNGTPVQSVNLVDRTSDGGEVDVRLDPSVIGASRGLNIEVRFQFVNPTGGQELAEQGTFCSADNLMGDWALVDKTSYFAFTPDKRASYNLDSLPFPFVVGNDWTDTTVVLGKKSTRELVAIMTMLGKSGTKIGNRSDVKLASASDPNLRQELTDRNLIYVGASSDLPADLNGYAGSYVKFSDGGIVSRSERVPMLSELARQTAVLQLTDSPISPGRSVLLLAATGADELSYIGDALSDPAANGAISGRFVAIDARTQVHAFPDTADKAALAEPEAKAEPDLRPLPYGKYVFPAVLAVMVAGLLVYVLRNRAKRSPDQGDRTDS